MELPIYEATLTDAMDGIFAVSLVDEPAVEVNFIAFNKDEKPQNSEFKFEIENQLEHKITGVLMLANTPIYRWSPEVGEYYIKYSKDTISKMAERMLKTGSHNTIDLQHDECYFWDKCNLVECYIKDSTKGIVPTAFSEIPDGSLIVTYQIDSMELWEKIESGEVKGFSLEGWFTPIETQMSKNNKKEKYTIMNKFKNALKALLQQFGSATAVDGTEIEYDGEELVEGVAITNDVADGDYEIDEKIVTIKDKVVTEIKDKETTEEEETETETEAPSTEEMEEEEEETETTTETEETTEEETETTDDEFDAKAEIEALKAEIEALKEQIAEIVNKPAVEPIAEEFSKINTEEKGATRYVKFMNKNK